MIVRTGVALGILTVALATRGASAFTPGGGPADTDCLAEFGGTPANLPPTAPRAIRCVDGDPACDQDPTPGTCAVPITACINVADASLPACAPASLDGYVVANAQPDTNPLHDFDFQVLEDAVGALLPADPLDGTVCTDPVLMNVPLVMRIGFGGVRYRAGKQRLRTTASGLGGIFDADQLRITCVPAEGSAPCDGVTSTFDELQRHVFTSTSCARSTCHNAAQGQHDLSLAPGEAYASLVGVPPVNPVAFAAGKLRVDPGNVANSFIVDKLRGHLVTGEGVRMPYGLRPLHEPTIQLVEQWIAAGAPQTGFVTTIGCH